MDMQQIGTKLTLDALDVELSVKAFDDRLIIQKAIYLAKAAGHDCGHHFGWYLRGPYSPELARDAFSIAAELAADIDDSQEWQLDADEEARLEHLSGLLGGKPRKSKARRLELLASVHFLVDRKQVPNADTATLVSTLEKFGKNYSEDEISQALRSLRDHELLPTD